MSQSRMRMIININNIIMKKLINKIGWCLIKKTCMHYTKEWTWTDYQEGYIKYWCGECGEYIYEDI